LHANLQSRWIAQKHVLRPGLMFLDPKRQRWIAPPKRLKILNPLSPRG
jgi:hypothetical protein